MRRGRGGGTDAGHDGAGWRQYYNFGQSELVDKAEFQRRIRALVEDGRKDGPLFLVFHGSSQDIKSAPFLSLPLPPSPSPFPSRPPRRPPR